MKDTILNLKETIKPMRKQHWYGIDYVKGILIIIVFLGHIIPGKIEESFFRFVIYAFHMPLFIGISGFLLNIENLQNADTKTLTHKYWKRIVLPWCIAVFLYYIVNHFTFFDYSLKGLLAGQTQTFFRC